jgi:hypothetical protein
LKKLDSSRATDDDSLVEVGITVAAIERILGVDENKKPSSSNQQEGNDRAYDPYDDTFQFNKNDTLNKNDKTKVDLSLLFLSHFFTV